jgi:hypothetical protein
MAQCHQELLLELNADCAEFCPFPGHHHWLSVGTYQLDEASSTRHGRLYLYGLQQHQQQQWHPQLQQLATLDVPGIFDLQWTHIQAASANPCMGLALADGTLRLVTVQSAVLCSPKVQQQQQQLSCKTSTQEEQHPASKDGKQDEQQQQQPQQQQDMQPAAAAVLQELCSCQAVASGMALALDWSHQQQLDQLADQQQQQQQQQQLFGAVSSSAGTISIVHVSWLMVGYTLKLQVEQARTAAGRALSNSKCYVHV